MKSWIPKYLAQNVLQRKFAKRTNMQIQTGGKKRDLLKRAELQTS